MTSLINPAQQGQESAGPDDGDGWFGGRRWTGIAAVAVLVVVGLCVAVVLVTSSGGRQPATDSSVSAPISPMSDDPVTPPSSLSTAVPTTAPEPTVWAVFDTVALPSVPGQGPRRVDGALATGYAHTPTGALLAAVNESYRVALADDSQDWRAAVQAMLAPGPGRDAFLALRAGQAQPPAVSGDYAQIQGYQFLSYTGSDAVLELVTRDVHGALQTGALHVAWLDGDWRLVLPASGLGTVQTTPSLAGFVAWSGV